MKKRAQITLVISIGVFILIMASLVLYLAYYFKIKNGAEPLAFEKISIENYVNGCIKKTAEDGLALLGRQGGLVILQNYLNTPEFGIEYSLAENRNEVPSIEKMNDELSFYLKGNLNKCLKDFDDFRKQGWGVEKGDFNAKTRINEKDVAFEVYYPIKISNDRGEMLDFEKFASVLNVRLKYIHSLVNNIVEFNIKNPKSVDRTALSKYDVGIAVFPYEGSLVYAIEDSNSMIMGEPYRFMFAMGFG